MLTGLHLAGLSTLPVRERLAGVAARVGAWSDATAILEQLMKEREKREGRIEAARLAMAIWRDKLQAPARAEGAVAQLLNEAPDDTEAVEVVLETNFDPGFKQQQLERAKQALITSLARNPIDAARVALLARVASFYGDVGLRQAALGALLTLGDHGTSFADELRSYRRSGRCAAKLYGRRARLGGDRRPR